MIQESLPSWEGVLIHIKKLRKLAVHLKVENPEPEDFLPFFRIMSDYVLQVAGDVSDEVKGKASDLIDEILSEHGYLDVGGSQS